MSRRSGPWRVRRSRPICGWRCSCGTGGYAGRCLSRRGFGPRSAAASTATSCSAADRDRRAKRCHRGAGRLGNASASADGNPFHRSPYSAEAGLRSPESRPGRPAVLAGSPRGPWCGSRPRSARTPRSRCVVAADHRRVEDRRIGRKNTSAVRWRLRVAKTATGTVPRPVTPTGGHLHRLGGVIPPSRVTRYRAGVEHKGLPGGRRREFARQSGTAQPDRESGFGGMATARRRPATSAEPPLLMLVARSSNACSSTLRRGSRAECRGSVRGGAGRG